MTDLAQNKIVDAETLWNTPIPPVRWVVPHLLPAGLALLAGASKAGKSWLCLWLCLQIARGGQVWGRQVAPRPVLYLCLEDTFNRIQSRLLQIDAEGGCPDLLFQTRSGGIGQGLEGEITTALKQRPGIGLVVIDTLQKVRSVEPSGSAYAADYRDMSALKQLADAHHICILLVHHLRKQGAADPFAQISGSTGLMGAACKNRHPSPICTRFEHHFHALKPHLHRRSFSDTLPENQRHLIALKRHPLWHMQKLCQLSQPAELRSTFFRNRNAVLCQDVLQLSNPLALSLEFFLSCVKVFHRLTLHLVVAGPFQF